MAGRCQVKRREASEELGVGVEDVRKRVKRGSLESDKDPDGRVYVYLPSAAAPSSGGAELVEELRDQVAYLRSQLDVRAEEIQRRDVIISQLTQATSNLTDRLRELEAPQEPEKGEEGAELRPAWHRGRAAMHRSSAKARSRKFAFSFARWHHAYRGKGMTR